MSASPFDAWVLPRGLGHEPQDEGPTQAATAHTATVRGPHMSAARVRALARRLIEGQARLAERPWRDTAASVGRVADRLLDGGDPLRSEALAAMEATTRFSSAMAAHILDGMARDWRSHRLEQAVLAEPPLDVALDRFVPGPPGRWLRARGHGLILHVGAGTVPGVTATSMVRGLLVKSAAWVKPGLGDVALSVLMARELTRIDPLLADAVAVTWWPGEAAPPGALEEPDLVVAYGGNDTIAAIRGSLPPTTPLVAYHHRLSVGVVAREALSDAQATAQVARQVARAIAAFDQRGCVSPQLLLVERGGARSPLEFAEEVSAASASTAGELPPGQWTAAEASHVQQLKGAAEMRAALDDEVEIRSGPDLAWTVMVDPQAEVGIPCVARTAVVRPVNDLADAVKVLEPMGSLAQSVGWAGSEARALELAEMLSAVGVSRVCRFREQAFPPPWWQHDGRPPLGPLVRWTEVDLPR